MKNHTLMMERPLSTAWYLLNVPELFLLFWFSVGYNRVLGTRFFTTTSVEGTSVLAVLNGDVNCCQVLNKEVRYPTRWLLI